ncbi:MAG TPA: hypothetical protein VK250_00280 [Nitrososphaeraceae archaeon]|nr:hypothetical protein [Nitrososphaeraceae archaeon]
MLGNIIFFIFINSFDAVQGGSYQSELIFQPNSEKQETSHSLDKNIISILELHGKELGIDDSNLGKTGVDKVKNLFPKMTGNIIKNGSISNVNNNLALLLSGIPPYPIGSFGIADRKIELEKNNSIKDQKIQLEQNRLGLLSTSSPVLTELKAGISTFNPPLAKCEIGASNNAGGFDMAKYVITGKFNRYMLKGDMFTFQIFADLVKDDGAEIEGKDAPYKANILTNNDGKSDIDLIEIATECIDIQQIKNVQEKTEINLKNSPLLKSLDY